MTSARLSILLMSAVRCGAATLTAGPLSFVGLPGLHIARCADFRRPSAVIEASILVVADGLGKCVRAGARQ